MYGSCLCVCDPLIKGFSAAERINNMPSTFQLCPQGSPGITDCWVTFSEPWGQKAYVTFFVTCAFIFPLMVIGVSYGAISCKVIRFSVPKEARVQKASSKEQRRKNKYSFSSSSERTKDEQETAESSVDETPLRKVMEIAWGFIRLYHITHLS